MRKHVETRSHTQAFSHLIINAGSLNQIQSSLMWLVSLLVLGLNYIQVSHHIHPEFLEI